jgi:hypothetical protein
MNNFMSSNAQQLHSPTPYDNNLHYTFLAEKELRLKIQEDLQNAREQMHAIIKENVAVR